MSMVQRLAIPAALVLATLTGQAALAEPISGSFLAVRGCGAFVSKNRLTNPDHSRIVAGRTYRVIERNRPDNPSHYRIVLDTANPKERWVDRDCGRFDPRLPEEGEGGTNGGGQDEEPGNHCPVPPIRTGSCNTCGEADSNVLALSWQPAFCESHRDKQECKTRDPNAFQARNFTLHGLFPNRNNCGISFGFCGHVAGEVKPFTNLPAVPLDASTSRSLAVVMPSFAAGSGLERHEWHKHGTCSGFTPDEYFSVSASLAQQFNQSGMAAFVAAHIGREIRKRDFYDEIDRNLGPGARDRVELDCDNADRRVLEEITITLPAAIPLNADLPALLRQAQPRAPGNKCGDKLFIDPIGQ